MPPSGIFLFIWVTIAPTLVYLASGVLCPGELESTGARNWREYFYANRRAFFFSLVPIWGLDPIDTILKGKAHFLAQGPLYLPNMVIWTAGSVVAGLTANEKYHRFWVICLPVLQIVYTTMVLLRLG